MAEEKKESTELHEYAGGWMTERKGTDAPIFLKIVSPIIAACAVLYLIVFMNGEVGNATRGRLVQQFNAATMSSSGFMYVVAALIAVYVVILGMFMFGKSEQKD